ILATLFTIPAIFPMISNGYAWDAALQFVTFAATPLMLIAIHRWPHRFAWIVNAFFVLIVGVQCAEAAMYGGLFPSSLTVAFTLVIMMAALVAIGLRAAVWWTAVYVVSVIYAVLIPHWVEPIYTKSDPTPDAAYNLVAIGSSAFAVMLYFVRQRDRFQKRSDDLLHNILPDEIAERLKEEGGMIAEEFPSASVLFADVVGFTPMSAGMSPTELVGLLNELFTTFDGFVTELGLEKIKTVGDEYMVAAGVPRDRSDHAHAIAQLALRIRDHVATTPVRGHRLALRIGINSGPVTAGIIGTHKFSYDLWGDTVNTASRMESEGIPGSIQVSPATYDLIKDDYVWEPRGLVLVKGKGEMETKHPRGGARPRNHRSNVSRGQVRIPRA
ncbi:MAG: adenylate/guanylate cyclase domain-containing protein, partial [Actinomycetota bacterium]